MKEECKQMILKEVIDSQKDLKKLCADRLLRTNEIFQGNAFYGNDLILKIYAGLPKNYPLKVVMPHGAGLGDPNKIWVAERNAPLPVIFYYSEDYRNACINNTLKFAMPSAYPFLYLLELLKGQPQPERQGTIFFPSHSTHHVTTHMNFEALADELLQLDDKYHPITVCMYWRDYNLGHHLPFQERGLPVVSAGHIYDPHFLYRFYHLCSMHKYAASNSLGSQIFYSLKSGCSYFHLDSIKYTQSVDSDINKDDIGVIPPDLERKCKSLFCKPQPYATAEQLEFVDYYMGTRYLKTPKELRKQLLYAEFLDKMGFVICNRGYHKKLVVPPFFRPARYYLMAQKFREIFYNYH
jgi:hypothetical protein